ncbi:MAG: glutamate racemase, partial [Rhodoferax sp.]
LVGAEVRLVDNGEPVARQTRRMLKTLSPSDSPASYVLLTTGDRAMLKRATQHWLNMECPAAALPI